MHAQLNSTSELYPITLKHAAARESGKFPQLEALKSLLRPLLDQNLLLYLNLKTRYLLILNSLTSPCVLKVAD